MKRCWLVQLECLPHSSLVGHIHLHFSQWSQHSCLFMQITTLSRNSFPTLYRSNADPRLRRPPIPPSLLEGSLRHRCGSVSSLLPASLHHGQLGLEISQLLLARCDRDFKFVELVPSHQLIGTARRGSAGKVQPPPELCGCLSQLRQNSPKLIGRFARWTHDFQG